MRELQPHEVAFVVEQMSEIENSDKRRPTVRKQAASVRRKVEGRLIEQPQQR